MNKKSNDQINPGGDAPRVVDLTEEARTARTWLLLFLLLLLTLPLLKFTFQALPELFCELLSQQLPLQMSDKLYESKNNWICPFALFQLHLLAPGHRSRRSSR